VGDDRVLETARLRLTPWAAHDAGLLVRLSALPEIVRHVGDGTPWARERALERAAQLVAHWKDHGFGWYAATEVVTGAAVGLFSANHAGGLTAEIDPMDLEIGWWIDPAVWGRGLAREGAAAVLGALLARPGAESVIARIRPDNLASIRVAEVLGGRLEAELTDHFGLPVRVYRITGTPAAPRFPTT